MVADEAFDAGGGQGAALAGRAYGDLGVDRFDERSRVVGDAAVVRENEDIGLRVAAGEQPAEAPLGDVAGQQDALAFVGDAENRRGVVRAGPCPPPSSITDEVQARLVHGVDGKPRILV